jgi:hypothetical protein
MKIMYKPVLLEGKWDWHTAFRKTPSGPGFDEKYVLEIVGSTMHMGKEKTGQCTIIIEPQEIVAAKGEEGLHKLVGDKIAEGRRSVRHLLLGHEEKPYHVLDISEVPRPDLDSAASKDFGINFWLMPKPDIEGTAPAEE